MKKYLLWLVITPGLIVQGQSQTRTSAQYGLTQEVVNGGGGSSTSALYAMESSLEEFGGIAVSSDQTIKSGYLGQLYALAGLNVLASPSTITEGETRQLSLSARLDDASILVLSPAAAKFSVMSGPILSVSSQGLAQAGRVYQTTPAIVRADYQGQAGWLTLQVLNLSDDDWSTYANDNLSDAWQVSFFGENNPQGRADADPDHDGQNNLAEYIVGTSPADANSSFKVSFALGTGRKPTVAFSPCLPNRSYSIEYTTNLIHPYMPLTTTSYTDNGFVRTVTDTNASDRIRFYRVRISQ